MARSIAQIQDSIITAKQAETDLSDLTSSSNRAIWRLWTFIVATGIAVHEQLMDLFRSDMEKLASATPPGSPAWIADKVLKFQYDASNPQTVQLINLVPQYPIVDPTLRIVTRCSVKTDLSSRCVVKVAKSDPPTALVPGEKTALQGFVNVIGVAGVTYLVQSSNADELYVSANVYYNGQYSAVISANVQAAIIGYLAGLPFDGALKISDLENTIRAVSGVNDVVLVNVRARKDADIFSAGTDLVLSQQTIARKWNTVAGYIIPETTTGKTLTDSLNFIAE